MVCVTVTDAMTGPKAERYWKPEVVCTEDWGRIMKVLQSKASKSTWIKVIVQLFRCWTLWALCELLNVIRTEEWGSRLCSTGTVSPRINHLFVVPEGQQRQLRPRGQVWLTDLWLGKAVSHSLCMLLLMHLHPPTPSCKP